jgi:hypothetical protein
MVRSDEPYSQLTITPVEVRATMNQFAMLFGVNGKKCKRR